MAAAKITVVGAGNVGSAFAHMAAQRSLGDIVLLDVVEDLARGKALDIGQCGAVQRYSGSITGTGDWSCAAGSSIVVVTSGARRTPGTSRDDLLVKNVGILKGVGTNIARHCPQSVVIVVANPLDAMVYTASKACGFPRDRILGMAGELDRARFSYFIAAELGVSLEDVSAVVLGGHGDSMVPLPRFCCVSGVPVTDLLEQEKIDRIVERTRNGGIEVVNLLGYSAYYAPAAGAVKMAEAILKDTDTVMPCCAWCQDQYGIGGYFVGVPAVLGAGGLKRVLELDLNEFEKAQLAKSVEHVRKLTARVDQLL